MCVVIAGELVVNVNAGVVEGLQKAERQMSALRMAKSCGSGCNIRQ